MNINRLRPVGVKKENLDVWLSSVVHDAIRDALEAGMPASEAHQLLKTITDMHDPQGYGHAVAEQSYAKPPREGWQREQPSYGQFEAKVQGEVCYTVSPEFMKTMEKAEESQREFIADLMRAHQEAVDDAFRKLVERGRVEVSRIEQWRNLDDDAHGFNVDGVPACTMHCELDTEGYNIVTTWHPPFEGMAMETA